jgi:NAD(P)-dependent dehydrogenase (short-subunit alcohol dehydrogenase family)
MTDDEWDAVIGVHLTGLVTACKELLPTMQQRKQGKIIALGSQSGLTGRLGQANYSAAKAGTIGFIKTLAREAGRFGVTANVVCPGFVDSKMTRSAPPEAWERAKAASALGAVSSAQTVASFIVWMVSDHCAGVTGQVFQLDSRIL